jgi:hypothetical protein
MEIITVIRENNDSSYQLVVDGEILEESDSRSYIESLYFMLN